VELLREVAARRPDCQLVLVGPSPRSTRGPSTSLEHPLSRDQGVRRAARVRRRLGRRDPPVRPERGDEFVSSTKTPEHPAAGRAVVSTGIADVVDPYGKRGIVEMVDDPEAFVAAAERAMGANGERVRAVDAFLTESSWD
jgi:hypothetical protein